MRSRILITLLILASACGAATKNIVPRATGEGSIGTPSKHWSSAFYDSLHVMFFFGSSDSLNHYFPDFPVSLLAESLAVKLPLHAKADSVEWAGVKNPPASYVPTAHTQDWSTITNQPSIPSAYDSTAKTGIAFGTKFKAINWAKTFPGNDTLCVVFRKGGTTAGFGNVRVAINYGTRKGRAW